MKSCRFCIQGNKASLCQPSPAPPSPAVNSRQTGSHGGQNPRSASSVCRAAASWVQAGPEDTARALLRDFHPGLQLCGREEGAWPSWEAIHRSQVQRMGGQRELEAGSQPFLGGQEPGSLGFCPGAELPSLPVLPSPQSSHL